MTIRFQSPIFREIKGKISALDWIEVKQLAQEGKQKESLVLLLRRAYGLSEEKIYSLPKDKVSQLLTGVEGIQQNLKCTNCGGIVDKLLCEKCVTFDANRQKIADELLQAAQTVTQNVQ